MVTFLSTDYVLDLEFLREITYTEKISLWPVGPNVTLSKFQAAFNTEHLFKSGYPKFPGKDQDIKLYLQNLHKTINSTELEFYTKDKEVG